MEIKKQDTWYRYICYFFIFCVSGWICEVIWAYSVYHTFVNRGYLHGFYLPVYGFGGIFLLFCLKKLAFSRRFYAPFLVFLSAFFIVSVWEYLASYIMELIFDKRWWDYTYEKYNLNGRIFLKNSILLAFGGMFFIYDFYPLLKKLFDRINDKVLKIASIIILIVMGIDLLAVLLGY